MRPKVIGLIVNPRSGLGAEHNLNIARLSVQALDARYVVTGPGQLGEEAVANAHIVSITLTKGRAASQAVTRAAIQEGLDALVVIGGDGTMADVAFAVSQTGVRCPLMGIGAGSINAGDLVTCKATQLQQLSAADFVVESVDALGVDCNDEALALAFNDVVVGTTIVGTVAGKLLDLDANAALDGRQIPGEPRPVGSATSLVIKRGETGSTTVSSGSPVGTVIVGFVQSACFFGKAIIGGVGLSSLAGVPAGCLVSDQPLVRTQLDRRAHLAIEPIHSAYVSLADDETIQVTGMEYPAVLCADGNPLKGLRPGDVAEVRVHPRAVDVLRITNRTGEVNQKR